MTAIAMIPAKAGSRRVPGKNMRMLGSLCLVEHTIKAALAVGRISMVTVLTDSSYIVDNASSMGANHMLRPAHLSGREVSATDVTIWAMEEMSLHGDNMAIVQLLPTSPFRTAEHINEALDLWERDRRGSVVSVREVGKLALRYEDGKGWLEPMAPPGYAALVKSGVREGDGLSIADIPPTYISTGGIQIASAATLRAFGRFHIPKTRGVVLDSVAGLDIDTEADWRLAEGIVSRDIP